MKKNELKAQIIRSGIPVTSFIKDVQIPKKSFYQKLNGQAEFKLGEIKKICEVLNLDDRQMLDIFFN